MREIFVFGSNLAGRHGAGSAKHALDNYGAKLGQGVGRQGESYAIPTKDENLEVLPVEKIIPYIKDFVRYAMAHSELHFTVVAVGCGLSGYEPKDIAPFFKYAPPNCTLPPEFVKILEEEAQQ